MKSFPRTCCIRMMTALSILLLSALTLAGCRPLARERTLPPSVRAVYVPMIVNRTSEPGLEERLTVELQKEILADGRLNLVDQRQADAIIHVTLMEFARVTAGLDQDDFPTGQMYNVRANLVINENIPGYPEIGGVRRVYFSHGYNADPRTTTFDPEPKTKEVLYRNFAKQIVQDIITGEYEDVTPGNVRPDDDGDLRLPTSPVNVGL